MVRFMVPALLYTCTLTALTYASGEGRGDGD
jgi:hypothetical protein